MLVGCNVKINRGGPDSVQGRLLAVNGEVLVLSSMGTNIYVNGRHVKSITEMGSTGRSGHGGSRGAQGSHGAKGSHGARGSLGRSGQAVTYITASTSNGVLSQMHQQFVKINSGGPEMLEGFLADINDDFILLIVGREFVRIPIYHIKTVSASGTRSNKSNKGGNKSSSGGNRSHSGGNRSHSGGNRSHSGGNRSHGGGNRSHSGGNRKHSGGNRKHGGGNRKHGGHKNNRWRGGS